MVRVIANKLFGNLVDMDYKRRAVVLSLLNADVRNREQQGIFIGGGELPSPGTEGRNLKYAEIRHSQEFSAYSSTWFLARMDGDVRARELHHDNAMIEFNLACYASVTGRFEGPRNVCNERSSWIRRSAN
jgi:hypothetical protein